MNKGMDVRTKQITNSHRISWGRRGGQHRTTDEPGAGARPPVPRNRRQGGALQDQALYSCGCGYVFNAAVSTSVGCPHCGDTQAW